MKKKILSLLLALTMVFGIFIPVNIMPETKIIADAAASPFTRAPISVSTYQQLDEALRQSYNGMVLILTQDITVGATNADRTITPDMQNQSVVLDLNGYNIEYTQQQNADFKGFYLDCANSNFYIINSAYDSGYDAKNYIGGAKDLGSNNGDGITTGSSFIYLANSTASCYIGPGVEIKGSTKDALVCLDYFKNFEMYESDLIVSSQSAENTTDCIRFGNEQTAGSKSALKLNKCDLKTKNGDCIDLTKNGTFTANKPGAMKFVLNHTRLFVNGENAYAINLSEAQNANSNVNVGDLCYEDGIVNVDAYLPSLGSGRGEGNYTVYGKIQSVLGGCDLYFFNSALRKTVAAGGCAHSNKENFFTCTATEGHLFRCSSCQCDFYYAGHTYENYKAPTATATGKTDGYGCNCGYVTYCVLPAETPVDPFTKVQEVATWSSLSVLLNTTKPTTIKLKNDIIVNDDNNDYTIKPRIRGNLVIDLNGYNLIVNSDKTQYLFDLSTAAYGELGTNLSIVSSTEGGGGDVVLNTNQKGAAVVKLANKANSFTASRVGIILGTETDVTTDAYAQTFAIDCSGAHQLNIYTADVYNYKQNGSAIRFNFSSASTFRNATVRIYRSKLSFKSFGLDFNNGSAVISASSFKDFTISNNTYFTPMNSTAKVLTIDGSANTIKLSDIVDADFQFVDGTYSVSPDKTVAYDNFTAGKEYWTKWRWNSSNQCAHTDYVTVLYAEFGAYQYCTRCKKASAKAHHIVVDNERTTYADCNNDGMIYYICSDTGCGYKYSVVDRSPGHVPNTDDEGDDIIIRKCPASCISEGVSADYFECFVCRELILLETGEITTENDVIIPKNDEHNFKEYKKCDPTCISDGWTLDFKQCKDCGTIHNYNTGSLQVFTGSDTTAFINAVRIPKVASNHKMTKYVKKAATCTEDGIKETFEICEYCNEVHKSSGNLTGDAAIEFFFDASIPKLSHKLTAVGANPATCTTDGNIAHWKCDRANCGKLFSDAEGTIEITDVKVASTGHKHEWVVTKPAEVGKPGEKANKCSVCGDIKETAPVPALEPDYILGDVDLDTKLSAADARLALRASVNLETLSEVQKKAADADKNNKIEAGDARLILRASVNLETLS